jgi:hypothetical protein
MSIVAHIKFSSKLKKSTSAIGYYSYTNRWCSPFELKSMEAFIEFISEIFLRRLLVNTLGYYTLKMLFMLTRNKSGMKWLNSNKHHELDDFNRGFLVAMVGLATFVAIFSLIVWIAF